MSSARGRLECLAQLVPVAGGDEPGHPATLSLRRVALEVLTPATPTTPSDTVGQPAPSPPQTTTATPPSTPEAKAFKRPTASSPSRSPHRPNDAVCCDVADVRALRLLRDVYHTLSTSSVGAALREALALLVSSPEESAQDDSTARLASAVASRDALPAVFLVVAVEFGLCLLHGDGGERSNVPLALQLLDVGATHRHPAAWHAVGHCLLEGHGVPQNPSLGLRWLQRAAHEGGYAPALHDLAELSESGLVVVAEESEADGGEVDLWPRDLVVSLRLYKRAAAAGYTPSMLNLGKLFLVGGGMLTSGSRPPSASGSDGGAQVGGSQADDASQSAATLEKARRWLREALAHGCREAEALLSRVDGGPTIVDADVPRADADAVTAPTTDGQPATAPGTKSGKKDARRLIFRGAIPPSLVQPPS